MPTLLRTLQCVGYNMTASEGRVMVVPNHCGADVGHWYVSRVAQHIKGGGISVMSLTHRAPLRALVQGAEVASPGKDAVASSRAVTLRRQRNSWLMFYYVRYFRTGSRI